MSDVYLIDGTAQIYRAFYAIRDLTGPAGQPTNAIYGFTTMLMKIMRQRKASSIIVTFDRPEPTLRHKLYDQYKAHRPDVPEELIQQIPACRDMVTALNLPLCEAPGFEADDVLATLAVRAAALGHQVFIVSGDKDMLQVVNDRIHIYDPAKDLLIDPAGVREKLSVGPERVVEYMALVGDSADNIPGVKGIGDKTARALLAQFSSLREMCENPDEIESPRVRNLLMKGQDSLALSLRLVQIVRDVPLTLPDDIFEPHEADPEVLREKFTEYGFSSLLRQLSEGPAPAASTAATQWIPPAPAALCPAHEKCYECVTSPDALRAFVSKIKDVVAFDTESTGVDPLLAEIVGFSLSVGGHGGIYVPLTHRYLGVPDQMDMSTALEIIRPVFENPAIAKIAHNLKYDLLLLRGVGIETRGEFRDTLIASHLLNPERQSQALEAVAFEELGLTKKTFKEVAGSGTFDEVDIETATEYAAADAETAWELAQRFFPLIEDSGLRRTYYEYEEPLIAVLADMESAGVRIATGGLKDLDRELQDELKGTEQRIYSIAGHEFNINSPKQLAHILFEELHLPANRKTKTGYSTDVGVLEELSSQHELPAEILNWRTLTKLRNTYVEVLPKLVHPKTGRVHTSFNQAVTATGRLSSSHPNLQNIPVRGDWGTRIRECFIAEPDHVLISADYSQIELRVLAHMSGDEVLTDAFTSGLDIHTRTASEIFNTPLEHVSKEMRRVAKTVNFGVIYGMSAFGLAGSLDISRADADRYIKQYFERHEGVRRFIDELLEEARRTGYVQTLSGRRRPVPELLAKNRNTRQSTERLAVNTPIQGTAADIIKRAMIDLHREIRERKLPMRMLLQVHDELLFESTEEYADEGLLLIKQRMEGAVKLSVPLTVDIAKGDNWAQAH